MEVIVHGNREVCPNRLFVGNQYENKIEKVKFTFPNYEGYHYLIINKSGESYAVPLLDDVFYVDSLLTFKSGIYESHAVISGKKLEQTTEIDGSVLTFISNTISLIVKSNKINAGSLSEAPLPKNIQIVYDELFNTYEKIKSDYDSGAFDGKDGYSPTLDVTPIDNGNRITITDINGKKEIDVTNGIDGRSAYELAVKNGFEGTEQEWLESLRYDHSDEFTALANQVKQDANSAADSYTKAENAMNTANQTAQENVEAINQASTNAQNAITTAKDNAVQAVQSAQQTAENAIGTKQTEAVQAVDTAKTSATQEITEQKESAVSAITQERSEAIEAIETAKDEAIEEIENTGVPLEDIEKLAIKQTTEGNPTIINDSADWRLQNLNAYGQSSQDGTPSPENPVGIISKEVSEIKVTGSNLCESIFVNENSTPFVDVLYCEMDLKKNATYYFSFVGAKGNVLYSNEMIFSEYKYFTCSGEREIIALTVTEDLSKDNVQQYVNGKGWIIFKNRSGNTVVPEFKDVQVSLTNEIEYEPYKSQTITLTEPITLRGIPVDNDGNVTIDGQQYVADEIDFNRGVYVQRTGKIVISDVTIKENIRPDTTGSRFSVAAPNRISEVRTPALCNYFPYNNVNSGSFSTEGNYIATDETKKVFFRLDEDITIEEFRQRFPDLTAYYMLEIPIEIPLAAEDVSAYRMLKTYYPNTIIDTGAWTKVEYVADTQKWIEKKLTGVTELALGGK